MTVTGGGTGGEELTPFDQRVAAIVGDTALTGVVGAHEGDTDHPQGTVFNSEMLSLYWSYNRLLTLHMLVHKVARI